MGITRQAQRMFTGLHARIYRWTGGRIGRSMGPAQVILLTTTGRKSGARRVTPLTAVPAGDKVVLIASNGGARRHPDWYLNLAADPNVLIQRGATVAPMIARTAQPHERQELWGRAVAVFRGYAAYQHRTDREIPVVICEPADIRAG